MVDNSTQGGADTIRDKDRAGVKTQIFGLDLGIGTGTESLMSAANPLPSFTPDVTASGTLTAAAQTVALALNGNSGAAAQITGTWVGTLQWEGTVDGTTWVPINAVAVATTGPASTTTVNGLYRLTPGNLVSFRVNCTAFTSGTVVVTLRSGAATGGTFVTQILPTDITRILGAAVSGTNGLPATAIASTIPAATTMQSAAAATGNGTNLNVLGYVSIIVNITGTFVATVIFEASVDDTTFVAISAHQVGVAGNLSSTTTVAGDFRISVAGYKSVRARISAFTSGTVTAKGYASPVAGQGTTVNANIISNSAVNQSDNIAQVAGTAVDVNSGVKSAGTMRVILATDQPALTNKLLVTPDSVALPANQSVNTAQVAGTATSVNAGPSSAGTLRMIPGDIASSGSITTQNLVPAGTATASSAVLSGTLSGASSLMVQVTGTYTGALSIQSTVDGTNWVTLGTPRIVIVNTGVLGTTIASASVGIFQVSNISGFQQVRVTGLAAMTGTAAVTMQVSLATGYVPIDVASINGQVAVTGAGTVAGGAVIRVAIGNNAAVVTNATLNSAATTNATSVKAAQGTVYSITASNQSAAAKFVKLYNKASAPTVGTDIPILTIAVPVGSATVINISSVNFGTQGFTLNTGIALAITNLIADSDATAVAVGDVKVMVAYI